MNPQVKLGLYVVTLLGTLVFGTLFVRAWRQANAPAAENVARTQASSPEKSSVTNLSAAKGSTNAPARTNEVEVASGNETPTPETAQEPEREAVPSRLHASGVGRGFARVMLWGFLAFGALAGLASMAAYDLSQYAANRAERSLFDDEGEAVRETTYELVEKAYGAGEYLEAIRLLREFLKEDPKAVHGQIRIAEIYEKDLNNPLAAALEYEEVLKKPLDAERKGWTAIHLVNLYNRLDRPNQAVELMKQIVAEVPDTPAAQKARERLAASGIEVDPPASSSEGQPPGDEPPPAGGLPRGFRRK
jgi:tetratricopeptide (TPR) repeat protein